MKSNSTSRVKDALAILKENAEEFTIDGKPKRKVVKKTGKAREVQKRSRK